MAVYIVFTREKTRESSGTGDVYGKRSPPRLPATRSSCWPFTVDRKYSKARRSKAW